MHADTSTPAAEEDAELAELLKAQADFLRSGKPAAATVSRVSRAPGTRPSLTSFNASSQNAELPPMLNPNAAAPPPMPAKVLPPTPAAPPVITEIREREPIVSLPRAPGRAQAVGGFPRAVHRSTLSNEASARLRGAPARPATVRSESDAPRRGRTLGGGTATEIDAENTSRVAAMSEAEILKAQAQLRESLDPGLVARIQKRRAQAPTAVPRSPAAHPATAAAAPPHGLPSVQALPSERPPLTAAVRFASAAATPQRAATTPQRAAPAAASTRGAMTAATTDDDDGAAAAAAELERQKMEWMTEAPEEAVPADAGDGRRTAEEALEAATRKLGMHDVRFDLDGAWIDQSRASAIDVRQGLHHHGDAPAAPGYTLAELSHLCRSTVAAQRAQALVTLAGVLRHATQASPTASAVTTATAQLATGRAVARWCRDADTAILARISWDDVHLSCVHAALDVADAMAEAMGGGASLAELLSDSARAATGCWRGCEGAYRPENSAGAPPAEPPAGKAAKPENDADVCRRDLFEGWMRTGACARLRYLLDSGELTPVGQSHALALLCRFGHRSASLAREVARTPHLMGALRVVLDDVRTASDASITPPHLTLVLLHILVASSRDVASQLIDAGMLEACHALLAGGFSFSQDGTARPHAARADDKLAVDQRPTLAAYVLGLWRCCAAYALCEPPLAALFPLFSQATRPVPADADSNGMLQLATFGVLETLCHLPLGGTSAAAAAAAAVAAAAAAVAEAAAKAAKAAKAMAAADESASSCAMAAAEAPTSHEQAAGADAGSASVQAVQPAVFDGAAAEESAAAAAGDSMATAQAAAKIVAQLTDEQVHLTTQGGASATAGAEGVDVAPAREADQDTSEEAEAVVESLGGRWQILGAYLPAALAALRTDAAEPSGLSVRCAGAAAHFVASYVASLRTMQEGVDVALLPWCEHIAVRLASPLRGACGRAVGVLRRYAELARSGQAGTRSVGGQDEEGAADCAREVPLEIALESLLGHVRLYWQLSRAHRGLLLRWAASTVGDAQHDGATGSSDPGVGSLLAEIADWLPLAVQGQQSQRAGAATAQPVSILMRVPGLGAAWRASPSSHATLGTAGRLAYFSALLLDAIDATAGGSAGAAEPAADRSVAQHTTSGHALGSRLPASETAQRVVSLGLCGASWMQPEDEALCRELVTSLVMATRWLQQLLACSGGPTSGCAGAAAYDAARAMRAALLPTFVHMLELSPAAEAQARARTAPQPAKLTALRRPASATPLPLAPDWLAAPTYQFRTNAAGEIAEASIAAQLSAALHLVLVLLDLPPLKMLSPSRLLCRGLQIFKLPGEPWRDEGINAQLRALQLRLCHRGPQSMLGNEMRVDVTSLVESVLTVYAADSFADPTFTQWALLPLRAGEPAALRLAAWSVLEEFAHKLDVAPPPPEVVAAWHGEEDDGDSSRGTEQAVAAGADDKVLTAFETSLLHGRLAQAPHGSFLRVMALQQLAAAAFKPAGASLLHRLAASHNVDLLTDLCLATVADASTSDGVRGVATRRAKHLGAILKKQDGEEAEDALCAAVAAAL